MGVSEERLRRIDDMLKGAVTATAVMMLWEEGKFQLDHPIARFLPEFEDMLIFESFNEADIGTNVKKLATLPLHFEPGSLSSTALDYASFLQMYLNKGEW